MVTIESSKNFQAGRALVQTYRQIGPLVARRYPDIKVIDIDVAPSRVKGERSLRNLAEADQRMLRMLGRFDQNQTDGKYLFDKALSTHAFLKDLEQYTQALERGINLEDSLESRLPWKEYCQEAGGFTPGEIPAYVIKDQYSRTEDAFKELGFNFDNDGWQAFFKGVQFTPEEFEKAFREAGDKFRPIFKELIKFPESIKYRPERGNEDKSWVNWITGDRYALVLKINTHPRNSSRFWRGNHEIFLCHEELAHINQARILRKAIDRGEINPGYGIMTVPGPEQFGSEGIALNLPFLLRPLLEALSPEGRFALEYTHLRNMVQANIIYDLHRDNPPTKLELVQRALDFLPPETEDRIKSLLDAARYDPVERPYRRDYNDGGYYFLQLARKLSEADCQDLVRNFFACPMTPTQIKEWVCQRKQEPLSQAS